MENRDHQVIQHRRTFRGATTRMGGRTHWPDRRRPPPKDFKVTNVSAAAWGLVVHIRILTRRLASRGSKPSGYIVWQVTLPRRASHIVAGVKARHPRRSLAAGGQQGRQSVSSRGWIAAGAVLSAVLSGIHELTGYTFASSRCQ